MFSLKFFVESNLIINISKKDEEIAALVKSISTDRPSSQCDLQQKLQQKQQEILQRFKENLFASTSLEELHVFENILAPLEPTLAAVRNQQKSTFVPLVSSTIPHNKSITPQRRLFSTNTKKKKHQFLQKPSAEGSDTLAIQLLYSDGKDKFFICFILFYTSIYLFQVDSYNSYT